MIEMRQFAILAAHVSSTVEHQQYLLVAFVLILPGDRHALARGGLPVDLSQDVAFAVLAQLVKLHAEPAAWLLAHAEPAQPVVHCHQWSTMQAGEVRVDAGLCM